LNTHEMRAAFSVLAPRQSISTTTCSGLGLGMGGLAANGGAAAAAGPSAAARSPGAVAAPPPPPSTLPLQLPLLLPSLLPPLLGMPLWPSPWLSAGCEMTNCRGGAALLLPLLLSPSG